MSANRNCMVGRTGLLTLAMVLAVVFSVGCQGNESLRAVRISGADPGGRQVAAGSLMQGDLALGVPATGRPGEMNFTYTEFLLPGTMMKVEFNSKRSEKCLLFFYIYGGDERQPLEFSFNGPAGFLNGQPVALDLSDPGAAAWLDSQPPEKPASLRTLALGSDVDLNVRALRLMKSPNFLVVLPAGMRMDRAPQLLDALVKAQPTGLVGDAEAVLPCLPRMMNLTHVGLGGAKPSDVRALAAMPSLQFLFMNFATSRPASTQPGAPVAAIRPAEVSLDDVASLRHLRELRLDGCDSFSDFRPLARLHSLQSLALSECSGLRSPKPLSALTGLESLVIGSDKLENLDGLDQLKNLKVLFVLVPKGVPLAPLTHLTKLKLLVVDKDTLKNRQPELDAVRRSSPGVEIIGFCMGSAWIVLVVPAGIACGLILRRRRRAACG